MAGVTTERRALAGATVAWITVERPEKLNALSSSLIAGLTEAIEALADDGELRCAVLTGAGDRAFIGGADIAEMAGDKGPKRTGTHCHFRPRTK